MNVSQETRFWDFVCEMGKWDSPPRSCRQCPLTFGMLQIWNVFWLAPQCSFVDQVCFTCARCAEAELTGHTIPDGPYRAVTLMTAVAFVTMVFVHRVYELDPGSAILSRTSTQSCPVPCVGGMNL